MTMLRTGSLAGVNEQPHSKSTCQSVWQEHEPPAHADVSTLKESLLTPDPILGSFAQSAASSRSSTGMFRSPLTRRASPKLNGASSRTMPSMDTYLASADKKRSQSSR